MREASSRHMIQILWQNGFANSLFQYCFGRILAEHHGLQLTFSSARIPSQEHLLSPLDYGFLKEGEHIQRAELPEGDPAYNLFYLMGRTARNVLLEKESIPIYGDYHKYFECPLG